MKRNNRIIKREIHNTVKQNTRRTFSFRCPTKTHGARSTRLRRLFLPPLLGMEVNRGGETPRIVSWLMFSEILRTYDECLEIVSNVIQN